jgi:hypothetical protein
LRLEWPAITAADWLAAALVALAGGFVALQCAVHDAWPAAGVALAATVIVLILQATLWTRSRRRGPAVLERDARGHLWWQERAGAARVPARLGPGTRVLGRSLLLEIEPVDPGRFGRRRAWLTTLDLPAEALRRWTVVLPTSGREACS